jgi:hypothetical protein
MNSTVTTKDLDDAIDSQKTKAKTFRPGTKLDPETGQEESRTGKWTPARDIRPGARPEEGGERSQNATGGKANR